VPTSISITLNAEGINLNVGATTVLQLRPASILLGSQQVDVIADTAYSVTAGELTEVVDGMASRTAGGQEYT
jgi:hypothetical protein